MYTAAVASLSGALIKSKLHRGKSWLWSVDFLILIPKYKWEIHKIQRNENTNQKPLIWNWNIQKLRITFVYFSFSFRLKFLCVHPVNFRCPTWKSMTLADRDIDVEDYDEDNDWCSGACCTWGGGNMGVGGNLMQNAATNPLSTALLLHRATFAQLLHCAVFALFELHFFCTVFAPPLRSPSIPGTALKWKAQYTRFAETHSCYT